jgi:aldoxime dehydratase
MDSAIPTHLRCPRTRQPRASEDYQPPYPAWTARFNPAATHMPMGYFGIQYRGDAQAATARAAFHALCGHLERASGPRHHDLAHYIDEAGYDTLMLIAYWDDAPRFNAWLTSPVLAHWWDDPARIEEGIGYFREILIPRMTHLETLVSSQAQLEGVAVLGEALSNAIQEHGYWGGMRDRLPISQTDGLRGEGAPDVIGTPDFRRRVRVRPPNNLAFIRSGQDWSATESKERDLYLKEVEPILRNGMDFLRDHGGTICATWMRRLCPPRKASASASGKVSSIWSAGRNRIRPMSPSSALS